MRLVIGPPGPVPAAGPVAPDDESQELAPGPRLPRAPKRRPVDPLGHPPWRSVDERRRADPPRGEVAHQLVGEAPVVLTAEPLDPVPVDREAHRADAGRFHLGEVPAGEGLGLRDAEELTRGRGRRIGRGGEENPDPGQGGDDRLAHQMRLDPCRRRENRLAPAAAIPMTAPINARLGPVPNVSATTLAKLRS